MTVPIDEIISVFDKSKRAYFINIMLSTTFTDAVLLFSFIVSITVNFTSFALKKISGSVNVLTFILRRIANSFERDSISKQEL
jgi:hypothetical protein